MAEARPVPRRVRLWVVLGVSLVLLGTIMNLVLVAEPAPVIEPKEREGRSWQAGSGAPVREGSFSWGFQVHPQGRRVVELDVNLPYRMDVTHVWGRAGLHNELRVLVNGELVAEDEHTVEAEPRANQTERVQRRNVAIGDMGGDVSPVRVVRDDDAPFDVVLEWAWSYSGDDDAEVTFDAKIHPVNVRSSDVPGVPLCTGGTCARLLFVGALVGQGVSLWWYRSAPAEDAEALPKGPRAPPPPHVRRR